MARAGQGKWAKLVAKKCQAAQIAAVVFDRNGASTTTPHRCGRPEAAARGGLKF